MMRERPALLRRLPSSTLHIVLCACFSFVYLHLDFSLRHDRELGVSFLLFAGGTQFCLHTRHECRRLSFGPDVVRIDPTLLRWWKDLFLEKRGGFDMSTKMIVDVRVEMGCIDMSGAYCGNRCRLWRS